MIDINEHRRRRIIVVRRMRAITDKCEDEKRELNSAEVAEWDRLEAEIRALDPILLANPESNTRLPMDPSDGRGGNKSHREFNPNGTERRDLLDRYYQRGEAGLTNAEMRALQTDVSAQAGYLTLGESLSGEIISDIVDQSVILPLARRFELKGAQSLGTPTLDAAPAAPTWGAEISPAAEDSAMTTGKRVLSPHPATLLLKVSNTLLRLGNPPPAAFVEEQIRIAFANALEAAFCTGSGAGQPLGIFTVSAAGQGVDVSRDCSTGNTITTIGADNLFYCEEMLIPFHRKNAVWIFSRKATRILRQLKDGDGRYLWQDNLAGPRPPNLIGYPVYVSESCPNTFTTGLYVGALVDLRFYWICFALDIMVQRLQELYARTNQTGFLARVEVDGMPVLTSAFVRVRLA